jgi:predicted nicotinamide N-methyase
MRIRMLEGHTSHADSTYVGSATRFMNSFDALIEGTTTIASPPLCPEVRLHLGDLESTWNAQESGLGVLGLAPPYWAVAWPGGQALARYLLDHPDVVRARSVLDLGSGSGLAAIAAALCGASSVEAADTDSHCIQAIAANARLNDVAISVVQGDLVDSACGWDVILAGDLWYERFLARRVSAALHRFADEGAKVLAGDLGRAFFPRGWHELVRYDVPTGEGRERRESSSVAVWEVRSFLHTSRAPCA